MAKAGQRVTQTGGAVGIRAHDTATADFAAIKGRALKDTVLGFHGMAPEDGFCCL
jgi:hypothetical protein